MALTIGIAPDSFKGTLSAEQATTAMALAARRLRPDAEILRMPMADGGEGTAALLASVTGGRAVDLLTTDPLGRSITATTTVLGDSETWAVDTAAASGLTLLGPDERGPLHTCSAGTGTLIRSAIRQGARTVLIGLGGSATVEGGKGLCQALGFRWLDASSRDLGPGGGGLVDLAAIDDRGLSTAIRGVRLCVAYDVRNPLCGPQGAAAVFGPQKGASPAEVAQLAAGLEQMAEVLAAFPGPGGPRPEIATLPGTGAAGGIGASLHALLGATLEPGAALVFEQAGYPRLLGRCDLVLVGEGRLDEQTAAGKAPALVASRAREAGIPVLAVAGCLGPRAGEIPGIVDHEAVHATSPDVLPGPAEAAAELTEATGRLLSRHLE